MITYFPKGEEKTMKTIGLIGAMKEELALIKEQMDVISESTLATVCFYEGTIHGARVVLVKSGVGKVNAAMTTQLLIDHFHVDAIIFTGVAGALSPSLEVADLVISTSLQHHDMDGTPLGFKRGEIPMFERSSDFLADEWLASVAYDVATNETGRKVVKGRIVSGDQFIADRHRVRELAEKFDAVCVEMEGAAVAQVAALNQIPFVVIRSISDKANEEANISFAEFTKIASEQSQLIVSGVLKKLT